ncbi:MAG TPA: cysteine hydrolase [Acidimicrobiales bacterium]|nr:cysteine hydrolase [Acidimicrobiales bacterium]
MSNAQADLTSFRAPPSVLERPPVDPTTTAVVVVDMVNWQVPRAVNDSGLAPAYYVDRLASTVVPNHERLLRGCRDVGARVVYLRVGCFQSNYSDAIAPFRGLFEDFDARDGTEACEVISEIHPEDGDLSLLKTASGGFNSSSLDSHLRNMGITHVLYTGVVTNACVMLTASGGFDLGYYGLLVADATAAFSPELQQQAENLIGYFIAPVTTTDEVLALMGASDLVAAGSPA